jgi:hypothetical protein
VSSSYLALAIRHTYDGMMVAIPAPHWEVFRAMSPAALAAVLRKLRAVPKRNRPPEQPIKTGVMWQRPDALRNGSDIERPGLEGVNL